MKSVHITDFGVHPDGSAHKFTLANSKGHTVVLTDIGAAICSVVVPDNKGLETDVALFRDSIDDILADDAHMGVICGRVAGRIENARFTLNGTEYNVTKTNPDDTFSLHGGADGFSKRLWNYKLTDSGVIFTLTSPDGDQGYPGKLTVSVTYSWGDDCRLVIDYSAVCDADTIFNPTNHVYFNLNGHANGDVLSHTVTLFCDKYQPLKENICPEGGMVDVAGTNMDFTSPRTIGERIDNCERLRIAGGYDFSFALRDSEGVKLCAVVTGDKSGITLKTYTDRPAVHLYTGNHLKNGIGKGGVKYDYRYGFCLETQNFPNAINLPDYPSPILRKGNEFRSRTVYEFLSGNE
ncbi:MAG: galactose mutarotase [Oscillospiraceae bacterium]|nr:galactose mutarotase [Oscillospiraceae bacterium]